nr:MAG TPA: hypothetical protein [Caudoviricetes sp.]
MIRYLGIKFCHLNSILEASVREDRRFIYFD